ncbi:MAG: signal peptidase I [Anaerorhabdus sp.]
MKDKINWKKEIIEFFKILIICFIIVFVITKFIVKPIRVSQNSMYPTIYDQSVGVSSVISTYMEEFERFDIVVLDTGEENYIIKRVIGLPGETIEIKDEVLYVNGIAVEQLFFDEAYYQETMEEQGYFTEDIAAVVLSEDEIYCLGDNRPFSKDSRHYGAFNIEQVISKGAFFFYPFEQFGSVK